MRTFALQTYGLPEDEDEVAQILQGTQLTHLELHISKKSDLFRYETILSNYPSLKFVGSHLNISLLENLTNIDLSFIKNYSSNTIIIPAAVEENNLIWPLSFLRRFPQMYRITRHSIDLFKEKSFRKKVAGTSVNRFSYFEAVFWESFGGAINEIRDEGHRLGYHNHGFEFSEVIGGESGIQILDRVLHEDIFFQFDITNILLGGYDIDSLFSQYRHRIKSLHLRVDGIGSEEYYLEFIKKYTSLLDGCSLVVELNENSIESIVYRLEWWKKAFN